MKLSEIYRVSRVTVRNAIQQLVNEDLLIKKHGKGTYVKTQVYTEEFFSGGSFTDTCLRMKAKPSTQIIESTVCHDEAEINAIFGNNCTVDSNKTRTSCGRCAMYCRSRFFFPTHFNSY